MNNMEMNNKPVQLVKIYFNVRLTDPLHHMIGGPDVDPMNQKWWCAYHCHIQSCHENYSHVSYWDGDEVGVLRP